MRLGFFLREALRSLRRNAAPSFAAMVTVMVTMVMIGVFIPMVQAASNSADSVRNRVLIDVYLKKDATQKDVARVRGLLLKTTNVKRVQFLSPAEALKDFRKRYPGFKGASLTLLGSNPLPPTFRVIPDDPGKVLTLADALQPTDVAGLPAPIDSSIDDVGVAKGVTKKVLQITSVVKIAMLVLGLLLVLASLMLIANTIQLSLFARRREVEVMKLVGATDWFIRWPFMIEGMIVGAVGALLALGFLGVLKTSVVDQFLNGLTSIAVPETLAFGALAAILVGGSVLISALGSGISLRRYLRV